MLGNAKWLPLFQNLLDLLYPRFCLQCNASIEKETFRNSETAPSDTAASFCGPCWGSIRRPNGPSCPLCAAPFPSEVALAHSPDHHCGECRESPPPFARAIVPFVYEGTLAKAIQSFKYNRQNALAAPLARLLRPDLETVAVDRVMAVPLHPRRLRSREFNQSLLLANQVARALSLPLLIDAMKRDRETPPQVGLSKKERQKNIHRAFSVPNPDSIRNQRILLIDDVYTTGATLREGAKTLIRAGAKEVIVAAVARIP
ncbi:MAG TPA: ComF family protein [Candidatus Manganitrophaceae bacterium]|nr:ComF family protein [Candidatus Manganitrophaceae bacterium]